MGSIIKKTSRKLHIWLGLLSGLVVFVVCITGCLYVFKDEINNLRQPWKFIKPQEKPLLPPAAILDIAASEAEGVAPWALTYGGEDEAVFVDYFSPDGMVTVFVNPYDGQIIRTVTKNRSDFDFFRCILAGHRSLWLPPNVGRPIVGWSILLFAVSLITGMVLWWPKKWNRKALKRNFTFHKKASWPKINFDLHNVLGFYFFPLLLILSFSGLIRSFDWFSQSIYFVTSAGKELKPYVLPKSETPPPGAESSDNIDMLYARLRSDNPDARTLYFALPMEDDDVIRVSVEHKKGSYYKTDNLFFDRYTLQSLEGQGPYAGKYTEASGADKLRRMNLDIHNGRILGLPGKILAFMASLIGASLPVTGFVIWLRRRKKHSQKAGKNVKNYLK